MRGHPQEVPRCPRPRRSRPRRPRRRGALPARPERRGQVHPDQGAVRELPARRGRDPLGGRAGQRSPHPRPRCALGISTIYQELDLVPDLSRRGEHLPRPRAVDPRASARPRRTNREAGVLLDPARAPRDPGDPRGRPAVPGGAADRQHGSGAVPRHQAARPRRAVRRARPGGGRQPLPRHPRPDRRGRRGRLHLPPARGDPPDRRPDHRAQGRPVRSPPGSRSRTPPPPS